MSENQKETVWIAGTTHNDELSQWEIIGVFSSEQNAVTACMGVTDFVGPLNMNEVAPRESVDWVGAYYPLVGKLSD